MLESDYIKALLVGYLPYEVESSNDISGPLSFYRRGLVAKRANELKNPDLETGKVVSLAWQLEFFETQTLKLCEPESDNWDLNIAMPLSANLHKLGLESLDREKVIVSFFSSPEVFKEMVPNRELDVDLALPHSDSRATAIGDAN